MKGVTTFDYRRILLHVKVNCNDNCNHFKPYVQRNTNKSTRSQRSNLIHNTQPLTFSTTNQLTIKLINFSATHIFSTKVSRNLRAAIEIQVMTQKKKKQHNQCFISYQIRASIKLNYRRSHRSARQTNSEKPREHYCSVV